jgi:AsmA protein
MTDQKPPKLPPTNPPPPPSFNTVRPGLDRPEDRPRSAQTVRPHQAPLRPARNPNDPPIGRVSRASSPPSSGGLVTGLIIAAMAVVTLIGGLAAYLTISPPVDFIRQQLITQVKAKTGRDLTISGSTSFKFYPSLALSLGDVTLSAPPNMGGAPLAKIEKIEARVKLWPLLQRTISVDQLVLQKPAFELRVDDQGHRSWDFVSIAVPVRYAQAVPAPSVPGKATTTDLPEAVKDFMDNASDPANPSPQMRARMAKLEEITLGDVRIEQGSVSYSDARTKADHDITDLNATIALRSLANPLDAKGNLTYEGQKLDFDVKLASLKAILEDRPAKLAINVTGPPVDVRYDGTVTSRSTIELDGDVAVKSASLRALTLWLGHTLPPADGYGPLSIGGKLKAIDKAYSLTDATLGLDGSTATGTLLLDTSSAKPKLTANLKITELDLNRYTLAAGTTPPAKPKVKPAAAPVASPAPASAKSIEDLINGASGPQVKGYTKRAGWSSEPIQLGALGLLDADAKISVGQLKFHDIKVGASALTVALKNKVLRTTFDDVALYNGHGRGFISVDSTQPAAVIGANLALDGVAARDLLKDVADFDLLAGTGKLTIAIGAQGATEAQLIQTSNGKADFAFANGAIVGYNIPGTIRGLAQGKFSGFDKVESQKTDFSELAASFTIANGIATNQDMRLTGPLLRVTGGGQIQLPTQSVDYTVKPKLVASLQGQTADGKPPTDALSALDIPLRIHGPWAKPDVTPNIDGILKDPSKAVEAIKEIGKQPEKGDSKELGNTVKGLLGKDGGKAKKFLNDLFKD